VQRSIYKDLVVLYHENRFIKDKELRAKVPLIICCLKTFFFIIFEVC